MKEAGRVASDVLPQKNGNIALIARLIAREDALYDAKEHLAKVENSRSRMLEKKRIQLKDIVPRS